MELLRIGELARRAGVPVATIKYYLREGLIAPTRKTGQTMSWYDAALVERLQAIKELQQRQFLPLEVIRESLDKGDRSTDDLAAADAIAKVLTRRGGERKRTREDIIRTGGATDKELEVLAAMGLAVPDGDGNYRGDDLALLATLGAARKAGITAAMLPLSIMNEYLAALRSLVAIELRMFREGVIKRAPAGKVEVLTTNATELSERLVVLIRRKLLLPTLHTLVAEDGGKRSPKRKPKSRRR